METKETGDGTAKPVDAPLDPAKSADAPPAADAAKSAETKPADEAKPVEADAAEAAPIEASPTLAKASAAGPPAPSTRGTWAGVAALLILLGGVLGTILIARHNEVGHKTPAGANKKKGPKKDLTPWKVGDKAPVVITVVGDDTENLVCAAKEEINGKHCAYESKDTVWPKDDSKDDKILLRPYATTGQRRLIAAGFWSQLPTPLSEKRFAVKCTFMIEGKLDHPWVKFRKTMEFKEVKEAWYAGELTDCTVVNPNGGPAASASAPAAPAATK